MMPDPKVMCPATGFAKSCRSIIGEFDCPKFVRISGLNPNTGAQMDQVGCADSFLPLMLLENSQMQRQTAASIDSLRNVIVAIKGNELERIAALETVLAPETAKLITG